MLSLQYLTAYLFFFKLILTRLLLSRDVVDKIAMRAPFSGVLLIFEQSHFTRYRALFYARLSDESKKFEKQSNYAAFSRNHRVTVNNSGLESFSGTKNHPGGTIW